ncbi:helix-turn-helix domain-containing protein [Candidatus Magnetaquicoccus inordinatus]|uniref:helix-turn-helix domain-containing protein n=1 Tax=Candidatus Magnetaquicoccus inordinatus TaxID=2496818 RepID=UPI001D0F06C2|nr:hypothetical protein [Candidatus Magnetaquicoccus inordinatus]
MQQWEQGQKKPSGPALRLLDLIDRNGLTVLSWLVAMRNPLFPTTQTRRVSQAALTAKEASTDPRALGRELPIHLAVFLVAFPFPYGNFSI